MKYLCKAMTVTALALKSVIFRTEAVRIIKSDIYDLYCAVFGLKLR